MILDTLGKDYASACSVFTLQCFLQVRENNMGNVGRLKNICSSFGKCHFRSSLSVILKQEERGLQDLAAVHRANRRIV